MIRIQKLVIALAVMFVTLQTKAQERIITYNELPKIAQQFIKTYYPKNDIVLVEVEKEFLSGNSYEVKLKNGIKLEFDKNGNWKEVDCKLNPVPSKIVPITIANYVAKRFPNNHIVQISRDRRKYEVELTNGLDLEFNNKGQFIRIDD